MKKPHKRAPLAHLVTSEKPTAPVPAYDVFAQRCPTRLVLDRLADKWALLVLDRLQAEPVRFNHLRRDIQGVSQKVLSQTLKKLERDGLVERTAFATVPVTVQYATTPLGRTLAETVSALTHWAEHNMDAVLSAQSDYDAVHGRDAAAS